MRRFRRDIVSRSREFGPETFFYFFYFKRERIIIRKYRKLPCGNDWDSKKNISRRFTSRKGEKGNINERTRRKEVAGKSGDAN